MTLPLDAERLVHGLARRRQGSLVPFEDMVQVGWLALLEGRGVDAAMVDEFRRELRHHRPGRRTADAPCLIRFVVSPVPLDEYPAPGDPFEPLTLRDLCEYALAVMRPLERAICRSYYLHAETMARAARRHHRTEAGGWWLHRQGIRRARHALRRTWHG